MQFIKTKKTLACMLAAMLALPAAAMTASADTEETAAQEARLEEQGTGDGGDAVEVEEETEKISVTAEIVEQFMKSAGTCDGYGVYLRTKDYKNEIEDACAALVGKEYADEDEAEDAAGDIKKALKNAEAVLMENGSPVAELEKLGSSEGNTIYFSNAGRYLLFLDDAGKPVKLRYRVSTLDSEYLFFTKDQKTLELYSRDYKEIRSTMTLSETGDGQCVYRSSDKQYFALLSENRTQAWACVRQAAENENFTLYVDEDTAILALLNKKNGYIWWSSPLNANRDTRATNILANELQSSMVLTYANTGSRGLTNLRSRNAAELQIKDVADGVEITYKYGQCGISVPVTYTLSEDCLTASVDCAKIRESKIEDGMIATQLTLLGSFGAGRPDEDGYFVIPDGCGALIRFNNGKSGAKSYSQKVYGRDLTTVPNTKPAVTEKILMPVYGIVREDNAMAVVIDEGDGNATLNASVSGQSLSSFNICSFSFMLRGSDTYYLSGDTSTLTVFEEGPIKTDTITLRYYPLCDEKASYAGVAESYRDHLLTRENVEPKAQADSVQMYLDLYGGTMKSRSVLGIPIRLKTSVTSYSEAKEIVSGLADMGVDDMVVVYNNWTNEGISGKVDNKAKPSGILGGSGDFNALTSYLSEMDFDFYPSVNNKTFKSGNGYYTFMDTTIRISNSYSRQMTYNLSYGVQEKKAGTKSLLSPAAFQSLYEKLSRQYAKKGLTGVSLGEMTSTIWGDYGKQNMSRDDSITALQTSYAQMQEAGLSILADTCAAYAFPYADRISDVPLQSSGFDVFDEDVPFYQMVLHGVIPYSGTAINGSADSTNAFLTSIATGCNPAYDMIYAEASDLKDTELDSYFYSHYAYWQDAAADEYKLAVQALAPVSDKLMTDYTRDGDVSVTTYEDGTEILVNYAEAYFAVNGTEYRLTDGEGE